MFQVALLRSRLEYVGLKTSPSSSVRLQGSSIQWLPRSKVNPKSKTSHSTGSNVQTLRKTQRFRTCLCGLVSQSYPISVESSFNPHTRLSLRFC